MTTTQAPQRRAWFTVLALTLLNVVGMTIVMPVLPFVVLRYLPDSEHLALWVGLLEAVNALCAFVAAPFLGALSDKVGRRPVIVIAAFGAALGFLIFGIGGAIWVLLLGRVIQGITAGDMPALFAYIADITDPKDRAKRFGALGAVSGAGFLIGPGLGGVLAGVDVDLPVFVTAGLALVVAIVAYFVLPESRRVVSAEAVASPASDAAVAASDQVTAGSVLRSLLPFAAISQGFRRANLRPLLLGFVLIVLPFQLFVNNSSVLALDSVGWGPLQIGLTTSFIGILDIVVQGVLLRWALKHWGEKSVILVGTSVQALGCLALVLLASVLAQPWLLVCGLLTFGAGEGGTTATMNGSLSTAVGDHEQGWMAGITQALQSGLGVVAPLLVGVLYTGLGHAVPYVFGVVLLVGALVVLFRARIDSPSRERESLTEPAGSQMQDEIPYA
jgi:DHA1 family tetracycline resistance protein-like MFS transporter